MKARAASWWKWTRDSPRTLKRRMAGFPCACIGSVTEGKEPHRHLLRREKVLDCDVAKLKKLWKDGLTIIDFQKPGPNHTNDSFLPICLTHFLLKYPGTNCDAETERPARGRLLTLDPAHRHGHAGNTSPSQLVIHQRGGFSRTLRHQRAPGPAGNGTLPGRRPAPAPCRRRPAPGHLQRLPDTHQAGDYRIQQI